MISEIRKITLKNLLLNALGGAILGFGLMEVHSIAHVTEGGALGLTLLLDIWFGFSPAWTSIVLNIAFYAFGIKMFGIPFVVYSLVSAGAFSGAYAVCELFPPIYPEIANLPFLAAIIGAIFVGVGVGVCVKAGGAPTGDDALAMSLSKLSKIDIQWMYMITDLLVLALSLTCIPVKNVLCSLVTVTLSGQIIGLIQKIGNRKTA
ncbi:MAG: YitT family protein [Clostridia bacterium]|nr:YitT family protein [Clostridia bacterium]